MRDELARRLLGARYGAVDLLLAKYAQYRVMGLDREAATVIRIAPEKALYWRWES